MSYIFSKQSNWILLFLFILLAGNNVFSQELASGDEKANALYITQDVKDASDARRDSVGNGSPDRDPYGPEELGGGYSTRIGGPNSIRENSTQGYYLTNRAPVGTWWYVSSGSALIYYDDLITVNFNTTSPTVTIKLFDENDYLLASLEINVRPGPDPFSAGQILTGNQLIKRGQNATSIIATTASGGDCDSSYRYHWQQSYDTLVYTNLTPATHDSLPFETFLPGFFNSNKPIIYFRRRVICGADTLYAGIVHVAYADTLLPGVLSPSVQSINDGQVPQTILGTTSTGGLCFGNFTYKWQFSNDNILFRDLENRTTDSLALDNSLHDTIYYRRIVFCGEDSVISNTVTVNVTLLPPTYKPGPAAAGFAPIVSARKLPDLYITNPIHYLRTYVPNIPIQDTGDINMNATVEDIGVATIFNDSYGRTIQSVTRQTSPLKKDNVMPAFYDQFGRSPISYLPFTSTSDDGNFKSNPFVQDSAFYKSLFPREKINYSETVFDGSPLNIPLTNRAPGNSWGGSGRGPVYQYRANNIHDSVRLWTIDINSEDDVPQTNGYYLPGTLSVQEVTDESFMQSVQYADEMGRTVMSKTLLKSCLTSGTSKWLYTYYVYDEMNRLRMVLPPKAVEALMSSTVNWNLASNSTINSNLCYAYSYDDLGRAYMKRIPGKGKSYVAYDLLNRVVLTQDPNLRTSNQWAFVLYDGQSRPVKSGVITSSLSKDSIFAQASRSNNYPSLSGTYTVTSETFYDDYSWIASTSAPVSDVLEQSNINSSNFITGYNTAPEYAQPLEKSLRIRGAVTGSKKIILNSNNYLYAVSFYDKQGRPIQSKQTNYTGGIDIASIQYAYNGRILRSHLKHEKAGTNAQVHTVLTKYSYDHVGRVTTMKKNFDSLGDKSISKIEYNELGQLKEKSLGDDLEIQAFSYNIRGWILGINGDYVKTPNATTNYFGELLSYDSGFTNTQYNGNIAGVQWKAGGDGVARAYGFNYDKANRLTIADFYQQNPGNTSWTKDKVDYTVSNLAYDANGNILSMKQRGLLVGSSATVDSLSYQYFANSNLLQKVTDGIPNISPLGDFKDTTSTGDDYSYDVNGNIIRDNNRHMHTGSSGAGAVFNMLDKPDSMVIAGKSGTYYYYDAGGATLRKQVNDYTGNGPAVKNYLYINGFVYLNDTLQYALTEEGRIRYAKKRNSQDGSTYFAYEYDYFIKDHQGNVRTVLTEGKDTAFYQATMEPANETNEDALFANIYSPVNTVHAKPSGFDSEAANEKVSRLNGSSGTNKKMGPSLVLKVMAGDKVQMNTYAFYNTTAQQPQGGVNLLADILAVLPGAVMNNSSGKLGAGNLSALQSTLSPNVTEFLNDNRPYDNTKPKAYLNWILFDEQFNFVATNSGVQQVLEGSEKQAIVAPLQTITKNGFLYIYVSNESPQDVYFDDITVKHFSGPLIQEQSYYPFGLQMAGISSKALLKVLSPYKYNAGSELEDEGELNYYSTFYRKYDAQIGRFTGIDVMAESTAGLSPFQFGNNNPIFFNDPTGAFSEWVDINAESQDIAQSGSFFWGLTHQNEIRAGRGMADDGGDAFLSGTFLDVESGGGGSGGGYGGKLGEELGNSGYFADGGDYSDVWDGIKGAVNGLCLYKSADAAALGWALLYNQKTLDERAEHSSLMYQIDLDGTTYYGFTEAVRFYTEIDGMSNDPYSKSPFINDSKRHNPIPPGSYLMGHIHSHTGAMGFDGSNTQNDVFSDGDLRLMGMPGYGAFTYYEVNWKKDVWAFKPDWQRHDIIAEYKNGEHKRFDCATKGDYRPYLFTFKRKIKRQ